jgi:UDPglucose 6-dehydrogenase
MTSLEVTVVGAGYVGLSTAVALALAGHRVWVVERDMQRLELLRDGGVPFDEPDLPSALHDCSERLMFTADLGAAVTASSIVILAVGTPPTPSHGADLTQLFTALEAIAPHLDDQPRVVVVKSTVPVGTHTQVAVALNRLAPNATFTVSSNPEFLRQGRALRDAVFPDRIVVGADESWTLEVLRNLYRPLLEGGLPVPAALEPHRPRLPPTWLEVSPRSAELAKYAANAFLAMKISFINEIANVCDETGADVDEIIRVLGTDARIGADFLRPGLGYGGSCFPKDTRALSQIAARSGYDFRLLRAVIEVNAAQRFRALDRLEQHLDGLRGKTVAVLGLTFKPDTDDLRESLGVDIALELASRGATVWAHDPVAVRAARRVLPETIGVTDDLKRCLRGADAAILVTEWGVYRDADWTHLGKSMRRRLILDGRNVLEPDAMIRAEFEYLGVGRQIAPRAAADPENQRWFETSL